MRINLAGFLMKYLDSWEMLHMDNNRVLDYINKMDLHDFENFAAFFFENIYKGTISKHKTIKNALVRDLEGAVRTYKGIYLPHCIPYELYKNPYDIPVDSPYLRKKLQIILDEYKNEFFPTLMTYHTGRLGNLLNSIYFINNIAGFPIGFYHDYLIDEYIKLTKSVGVDLDDEFTTHVGSFDTFIASDPEIVVKLIDEYSSNNFDVSFSMEEGNIKVQKCANHKYLTSGVGKITKFPYNSLVVEHFNDKSNILKEFEDLLNKYPTEDELEKFLGRYYKEIFGNNYDKIEMQLWLRFPEIDIANKNRRLDIFLHNNVINDWELFELKKIMPLTKSYRDIPVFRNEIYSAIQQLKNYDRILQNHEVKEKLKRDGIEYYEPSLNLVVGRTSTLPHDEWRWLATSNKDIKILTYDNLLTEMSNRLKAHLEFLEYF